MGSVFLYIVFGLECIIGVASSVYIVVSLFVTIISKFVRKAKYKISLFD